MAVHKYTSWGRTRRPKPASGNDGDYITGSVGVLNLNQLNKNQFNATNGIYKTENQRYAHIACSGSSTVSNVFVYSHAMACWHELVQIDPTDSSNRDSIVVGNDQYVIVDINGADYISLKSGSLSQVTMAFSTF